jgi:uncharacterized membrane protein
MAIRNPIEWGMDQLRHANEVAGSMGRPVRARSDADTTPLAVRRIAVRDVWEALAQGVQDFAAGRTDVIFLTVIYPVIGLVLARLAFGEEMLPLLFPLLSGFALVGPIAGIGLYEMSRRREQGAKISFLDAFGVVRAPAFGEIVVLGLMLLAIFLFWLVAAEAIYRVTLGPDAPVSLAGFVHDVLTTDAGWVMIGVGVAVGFLFAVLVLSISVVSFPLLLDRAVGIDTAVATSVRAVRANPGVMALWGAIVAGGLVLGSLPLLLGLVIVMPVLGHATWHLYRKMVV